MVQPMARQAVNWQALIDGLAAIEATIKAEGKILKNEETTRYVRLQKFVRELGQGQSRDGTLQVAREFDLTWSQAARLYISLGHLAVIHRIGKAWKSDPARGAIKRELVGMKGSIRRIAKFQNESSRLNSQALHYIAGAANRWAETQDFETLQRHGFQRREFRAPHSGVSGIDFASTSVICGWFELAPLMSQFVTAAIDKLGEASSTGGLFSDDGASAIVNLVGNRLPALYEQVTGKRYGISKPRTMIDAEHDVVEQIRTQDAGGVRFVRMSLVAMGLDELSPDTIASYRQRYLSTLKQTQQTA